MSPEARRFEIWARTFLRTLRLPTDLSPIERWRIWEETEAAVVLELEKEGV